MSTSISLTVSPEQEFNKTSKSYCDLRRATTTQNTTTAAGAEAEASADAYLNHLKQPSDHLNDHHLNSDLDNIIHHHHRHHHQQASPSRTTDQIIYGRRHTGSGLIGAKGESAHLLQQPQLQFEHTVAAGKLKRWRYHNQRQREPSESPRGEGSQEDGSRDFYAEVDDRMSRNSFEYPMQQARYIDRWLSEASAAAAAAGARSKSFDGDRQEAGLESQMDTRGNVIGIRGFSSESFIAESRKCREEYARLKQDHLRLQVDYRKLRARLMADEQRQDHHHHHHHQRRHSHAAHKKRHSVKQHDDEDDDDGGDDSDNGEEEVEQEGGADDGSKDALRVLVMKQGRRLDEMTLALSNQAAALHARCDMCKRAQGSGDAEGEVGKLEVGGASCVLAPQLVVVQEEQLRRESDRLKQVLADRDAEVRQLRGQLGQLEPSANRKLLALASENARLRGVSETEQKELVALKGEYLQLESRLRSLMESQKSLSHEQGDEFKQLMLELCRFQVNQPKLEMILETEGQIRVQLQEKIEAMSRERDQLEEQARVQASELNDAKLRARSHQSQELERCRSELTSWQLKCQRLEEEGAQRDELLRASRAKVAQLDARLRAEVQQVRDSHHQERDSIQERAKRCEHERDALQRELARTTTKLEQCDAERRQTREQVLELHHKLALAEASAREERTRADGIPAKLEQCERDRATIGHELAGAETRRHELARKLELAEAELEQTRRQLGEVKRRFELQQKTLDESCAKRDRELAKLRVDLNFERYNRQVSLRGIEKELRSSLRELEAMKYRFSRRLSFSGGSTSGGGDGGGDDGATTTNGDCQQGAVADQASPASHQHQPRACSVVVVQHQDQNQKLATNHHHHHHRQHHQKAAE